VKHLQQGGIDSARYRKLSARQPEKTLDLLSLFHPKVVNKAQIRSTKQRQEKVAL
jgi:hypothetical protein